jgi:hypothetical protein
MRRRGWHKCGANPASKNQHRAVLRLIPTKKQSCAPLCLSNAPGIARALAQNKRQPLVRLQRRRLHQRRDATEARGAYLLLILDCYATASRNRHDPRRGRQAAGRGVDQEAPFFDISDGYWFHDAEEKHTARIQSARNAIKANQNAGDRQKQEPDTGKSGDDTPRIRRVYAA